MSQRLTKFTNTLPVHPRTGQTAIGVLPSGRIVWPISGAAEDGENDKKDDTSGSAGSGDGNTGGADGGDSGSSGGDPGSAAKSSEAVAREEYEALHRRMQAADQRASNAEKQLRELTDKEKSELEKAQRDLQETQGENAALKETVKTQAVRLAFLTSASHITWHDPEDALAMAMRDLSDIEVKDDGTVDRDRVKSAAEKLSKSKPYLVKSQETSGDGSGEGNKGKDAASKSGDSMNGGSKDNKDALSREKLAQRFPALRR